MNSGPVALASDHGGFSIKEALARHLTDRGVAIIDVGTHSKDACDYPVYAKKAAEEVSQGRAWRAVVVDGAGIGSCMVANKVPGVRAGMAFNEATAKNAREHNNANLLTLGAGYLDEAKARAITDIFLSTECTVDRHLKRVAMIDALDLPNQQGGRDAGRSVGMKAGSDEKQRLVEQITQVLSRSPQLLATLSGGGSECMTCPSCDKQCAKSAPDVVRSLVRHKPAGRVSARLGVSNVPPDLAKFIDHTLLRADANYSEIAQLCAEARKYSFASVCVNPVHVRRCADALRGSTVLVCTVIGFPLGATPRENKAMETRKAIRDGAKEVDMVINIGALKSGDHDAVYEDIRLVREAAHEGGALLKVIIETALLTDEEKTVACKLSKKARADFVKTSTGFSKGGATAHDVALMANAVDHQLGVKASGGVRSASDAKQMIAAGASRIGASVGIKIVQESQGKAKPGQSSGAGY